MTILDEIFEHKHAEVIRKMHQVTMADIQSLAKRAPAALDFVARLRLSRHRSADQFSPALIAEIKRASPSKGILSSGLDPVRMARIYRQNGASAISVLTDARFFNGHIDHLRSIAQDSLGSNTRLPILCKDFIFHPYQVYEARAAGADAILLIAARLKMGQLRDLHSLANELGMAALVEVHNSDELHEVLKCDPVLIGINNRDLRDFSVDIHTTIALRPFIPPGVCVVAESGIQSRDDLDRLIDVNIDAILIGEALVKAPDVAAKVRELSGFGVRV
jgi:indole-3-glycerol phosphate synthase